MKGSIEFFEKRAPRLFSVVMAAGDAISDNFNVCRRSMCSDLSHVGSELLHDAGYDAWVVGVTWSAFIFRTDHAWIRAGDWNVDFSISQFTAPLFGRRRVAKEEDFQYPFVTKKDEPLALEVYGDESAELTPRLYDKSDREEMREYGYPFLEDILVDHKMDLGQLPRQMDVYAFYRAVKQFRESLRREGILKKSIPALEV